MDDDGYVISGPARIGGLHALWRRRSLLFSLTLREAQIRYRQAFLGALWALAQPLVLMVVTTLVFHRFLGVEVEGVPYPLFAFPALVVWTYVHTAVTSSVGSLVTNADLVRKIWFPREGLPLAAILAILPDLAVGLFVWLILILLAGLPLPATLLLAPLLLGILIAFTVACALFGSAVNVFFRDVKHGLPFLLQVVFFATPIVYPLRSVPPPWRALLVLNPLTSVVEGLRAIGLEGRLPDLAVTATGAAIALVLCALAYRVFLHAERRFADVV